jgi:hypothetical protein
MGNLNRSFFIRRIDYLNQSMIRSFKDRFESLIQFLWQSIHYKLFIRFPIFSHCWNNHLLLSRTFHFDLSIFLYKNRPSLTDISEKSVIYSYLLKKKKKTAYKVNRSLHSNLNRFIFMYFSIEQITPMVLHMPVPRS